MARISTGTGDDGTTGLVGGARVSKASARVAACGAIDEANDALGLAAAFATRPALAVTIRALQADLFVVGADLMAPEGGGGVIGPEGRGQAASQRGGGVRVEPRHVEALVAQEDRLEAALPPLRHFVLPGGTPAAAHLQLARSIVRRAEREAWRVAAGEPVSRDVLVYLNRLSDLLFLLAREENVLAGVEETLWVGRATSP